MQNDNTNNTDQQVSTQSSNPAERHALAVRHKAEQFLFPMLSETDSFNAEPVLDKNQQLVGRKFKTMKAADVATMHDLQPKRDKERIQEIIEENGKLAYDKFRHLLLTDAMRGKVMLSGQIRNTKGINTYAVRFRDPKIGEKSDEEASKIMWPWKPADWHKVEGAILVATMRENQKRGEKTVDIPERPAEFDHGVKPDNAPEQE